MKKTDKLINEAEQTCERRLAAVVWDVGTILWISGRLSMGNNEKVENSAVAALDTLREDLARLVRMGDILEKARSYRLMRLFLGVK